MVAQSLQLSPSQKKGKGNLLRRRAGGSSRRAGTKASAIQLGSVSNRRAVAGRATKTCPHTTFPFQPHTAALNPLNLPYPPPVLMSSSPQSSHRSAAFGQVFVYETGARFGGSDAFAHWQLIPRFLNSPLGLPLLGCLPPLTLSIGEPLLWLRYLPPPSPPLKSSSHLSIPLSIYPSISVPVQSSHRSESIHLSIYSSICPSIHLSNYPSISASIHLSVHLSTYPSIHQSLNSHLSPNAIYLSFFLSFYFSICLSFYLSIFLPIYLSIYLSLSLSIDLSFYPSIHLSIYVSMCLCIKQSTNQSINQSTNQSINQIYLSIYRQSFHTAQSRQQQKNIQKKENNTP